MGLEGVDDAEGLLRQTKRLALLSYLAVRTRDGFCRRDQVVALFWPDADAARARNSLSQSLHQIRRSLGTEVVSARGNGEIRVDPAYLRCDATDFEALLAQGREEEALALYRGDFLDGLHVPDAAPELEQWMDRERSRLRDAAVAAAIRAGERAEATGEHGAAVTWFRRAARIDPSAESVVRSLVRLVAGQGDRASALALYEEHARRLEEAYGLEPAPETRALVASLRTDLAAPAPPPTAAAEAPRADPDRGAPSIAAGPAEPPRRRRAPAWTVGAAAATLALVVLALPALRSRPAPPRVVALGAVEVPAADSLEGLGEMLASGLARIPGLEVVGSGRMEEVRVRLGAAAEGPDGTARVASAAGADELMEVRLSRRPGGSFRLELQRRDLRRGTLRGSHAVEAADPTDLVDLAVEAVARDLGVEVPLTRMGGSTASLPAYRLYQEGLRAYYAMDPAGAARLFRAALAEDTTFAMAAHYASLVADTPERWDLQALAVRLSERAPERERLLIRTTYAASMQDPAVMDLAAELADRYPTEPDGHLQLGRARTWSGDFAGAVAPLRLVLRMDSLEVPGAQPRCRSCEAYEALGLVYRFLDSVPAAERVARERVAAQPGAPALVQLAEALEFGGRLGEALEAVREAEARQPGLDLTHLRTSIYTRAGDFDGVERAIAPMLASGNAETRREALWGRVIALRTQGRLAEALEAARLYRSLGEGASSALPEATVRFERGEHALAAALYRAMADAAVTGRSPSLDGRQRAWSLVHMASAVAGMGDTAGLRALEDSVRVQGERSAYARDQRLHHHVRGLRLRVEGRPAEAAEAFRAALFSPVEGYVRTSLELARALQELGRWAEALDVARSALRGPVGASGLYATRTELQEVAGRSFEALGQADSASAYYGRALAAWASADAPMADRVAALRARAGALTRP